MDFLKNKKYPYAGGGQKKGTNLKSQSLSEGWKNIKSELGKAFDFMKKKKKDEEES